MTLRLASGLSERGIPTELVLFSRSGELATTVPSHLRVIDLGTTRSSKSIFPLVRYFRSRRPTVAFTTLHHTSIAVRTALVLSRADSHLVVRIANHMGEIRATRSRIGSGILESLLRWTYNGASLLTTVSNDLAEELGEFLGGSGPRIVTRYNPVIDSDFFSVAAGTPNHRWLREPSNTPVIVTAGRLTGQKDHVTLLHAFKQLLRVRPARLIIFGEGPDRDALVQLCDSLGISAQVDLPGFDSSLPASLAKADLFVLSSRWEGLPGVLIQALALNVPIVSTNCPTGPSEILENGRWGHLVPVGDSSALASAMIDAMENPRGRDPQTSTGRFQAKGAIDALVADLEAFAE